MLSNMPPNESPASAQIFSSSLRELSSRDSTVNRREEPRSSSRPVPDSFSSGSSLSGGSPVSISIVRPDKKYEAVRLATFRSFPNNNVTAEQLAADGFFATGDADTVQCAFCGVQVGCWEPNDNPALDHRKFSPNCDFVLNKPCGNVPLSVSGNMEGISSNLGVDTCGPYGLEPRMSGRSEREYIPISEFERLGIIKYTPPRIQDFNTYEARLKTFKNWPSDISQRPEELAEAGFFYRGVADQTLCFHCGGGLNCWQEGDEPWLEHAKWFSKCLYVVVVKGTEFVQEVIEENLPVMTADDVKNLETPKKSQEVLAVGQKASEVESLEAKQETFGASSQSALEKKTTAEKDSSLRQMCKICMEEELGILFLPCRHLMACVKCSPSLSHCALCRRHVDHTIRIYIP